METQHAHWVLGSCLLAIGHHQEDHQGGSNNGGKLRHSAWYQLHPEEAHHQSISHFRYPTFLEHAAEVKKNKIQFLFFLRSCRALMMMTHYCTIGFMIVLMCYIQTVLPASTKLIRCWYTSSPLIQFLRITWFLRAQRTEFLCFTSHLVLQLRYCFGSLCDQ